jgi:hypothetical protein
VARLAIAKSFLAEYAKLDKDARRAVEAVVTEFAQRPHAWRYLEKPRQGLDDRIRLFRVNSLWRGVVLAPDSGDTYCLVTILPHDKALAYAAGHRFSVNQALGVLEARDEGTNQQVRPSLESAAGSEDRPPAQLKMAASRAGEFAALAERIRTWLGTGIEPQAIGVAARSAILARHAREALKAAGIMTVPLRGRGDPEAVRVGTMHAMKGLEFQAVAVIGVEQGLVPEPAAITAEGEDAVAHAQDLQRERCVLFAACTRARDHLFVSGTGAPSPFLPSAGVC